MSHEEIEICIALGSKVKFLPASWDKSFSKTVGNKAASLPGSELTPPQKEWIYRLLYRYRRQIPSIYEKYKGNEFCGQKEPRKIS